MKAAFESLRPGDLLRLQRGICDVGGIHPTLGGGQVLIGLSNKPSVVTVNNFAHLMNDGQNVDPYGVDAATYTSRGDNTAHPSGDSDLLLTGGSCANHLAANTAVATEYGRQASGTGTVRIS